MSRWRGILKLAILPRQKCGEVSVGYGLARLYYYAGAGDFAERRGIGYADDLRFADGGMLQQKRFDFGGIDVLSAYLDLVFVAAQEADAAVVADGADVSGMEPAGGVDGIGGGFRDACSSPA